MIPGFQLPASGFRLRRHNILCVRFPIPPPTPMNVSNPQAGALVRLDYEGLLERHRGFRNGSVV